MSSEYTIHKPADVTPQVDYNQATTCTEHLARWLKIKLGKDEICIHDISADEAIALAVDIIYAVMRFTHAQVEGESRARTS